MFGHHLWRHAELRRRRRGGPVANSLDEHRNAGQSIKDCQPPVVKRTTLCPFIEPRTAIILILGLSLSHMRVKALIDNTAKTEEGMSIFITRMEHPKGPLWNMYVIEHVEYLQALIEQGHLLTSGPVTDSPLRAGFLIFKADSKLEVHALINEDPFARENIISALTIEQWDPLFGLLAGESSKRLPSDLAKAT